MKDDSVYELVKGTWIFIGNLNGESVEEWADDYWANYEEYNEGQL